MLVPLNWGRTNIRVTTLSALTGTDPGLLMEVEPANAHEFVICCGKQFLFDAFALRALRRWPAVEWQSLPATVSLFG